MVLNVERLGPGLTRMIGVVKEVLSDGNCFSFVFDEGTSIEFTTLRNCDCIGIKDFVEERVGKKFTFLIDKYYSRTRNCESIIVIVVADGFTHQEFKTPTNNFQVKVIW